MTKTDNRNVHKVILTFELIKLEHVVTMERPHKVYD